MSKNDPYHDNKPVHRAKLVAPDGGVSPLCAKVPRRINMRVATWTITDSQVTCKKCLKIMNGGTQ